MSNPVCISPLKFYDSPAKQNHRKSYAHGHISPLITKIGWLPPFQFVIPTFLYNAVYNRSISYYASGSINIFSTPLPIGSEIVSFGEGINAAALDIDNTGQNYDIIQASQLPFTTGKVYVGIHAYQAGTPQKTMIVGGITEFKLFDAKNDTLAYEIPLSYIANFDIFTVNGYKVLSHSGRNKLEINGLSEGLYYLKLASTNDTWAYYSEVFCFTEITQDLLEIEYWNEAGDFNMKNGIVSFANNFHFKLLLKSELGKPEYNFEEESTKRLGYIFIESQVSKKVHKFNTIVPEFICDAMRLIRLCDNKLIRSLDEEYDAMSFEMEAEWQTQGDLASVNCEFETDNVVVNLGGFIPDKLGGDYNNDHNIDFDNQ